MLTCREGREGGLTLSNRRPASLGYINQPVVKWMSPKNSATTRTDPLLGAIGGHVITLHHLGKSILGTTHDDDDSRVLITHDVLVTTLSAYLSSTVPIHIHFSSTFPPTPDSPFFPLRASYNLVQSAAHLLRVPPLTLTLPNPFHVLLSSRSSVRWHPLGQLRSVFRVHKPGRCRALHLCLIDICRSLILTVTPAAA